jgi:hypothetical protein
MAQTLFGLTFEQALQTARDNYACESQIRRIENCGNWEEVLRNERLWSWLEWMSVAEVPVSDECECSQCLHVREALTPEKVERSNKLKALHLQALQANEGFDATHAIVEALLREHLQDA